VNPTKGIESGPGRWTFNYALSRTQQRELKD